jgi:hypothetical protein
MYPLGAGAAELKLDDGVAQSSSAARGTAGSAAPSAGAPAVVVSAGRRVL